MTYRIRAHHGMCFSFFRGKGYSGAFTDNMWKMKEKLERDAEVILLQETDEVCACCPNNRSGRCISGDKVEKYDRQVLERCGLAAGDLLRWSDFEELVRENIITPGRREDVCGDCEWNEVCRSKSTGDA